MHRSDKLHHRLEALEHDFRAMLVREFQAEAIGGHSRYLSRKYSRYLAGRQYRDTNTGALESLEKDIMKLRRKLKLDVPGPIVALVEQCVERYPSEIKP